MNKHDRAFVRTEHLPQSPPPVGDIRRHRLLKIYFRRRSTRCSRSLAVYLIYMVVPPFVQWAFLSMPNGADSNKDCAGHDGACWAVVTARFGSLCTAFTRKPSVGGVNLVLVLFAINLLPVLWDRRTGPDWPPYF